MSTNIYTIVNQIQKTLKAPKGQYNSFGKYSYRSCEDILEAIKPLLPEQTVLILNDDVVLIGSRFYIKATATISYNGETISSNGFAREDENRKGMDSSQITGATSSYARKYALNALFCIDDQKDSDTTNQHNKSNQPQQQKQLPELNDIVSYIQSLIKSKKAERDSILLVLKIKDSKELSNWDKQSLIDGISLLKKVFDSE